VPAVQLLVDRTPLPVEVTADVPERLPAPVEAAIYYVAAESLTSVAKHAEATYVELRVGCGDGAVAIEVADNGAGGAEISGGSGLRGLAARVEALGGGFGVESPPGGGTRVWARIPLA